MEVPKDIIENFKEESVIFNIETMNGNSPANYQYHLNPLEKVIELYERLLQIEKEKNTILQQFLAKKDTQ